MLKSQNWQGLAPRLLAAVHAVVIAAVVVAKPIIYDGSADRASTSEFYAIRSRGEVVRYVTLIEGIIYDYVLYALPIYLIIILVLRPWKK